MKIYSYKIELFFFGLQLCSHIRPSLYENFFYPLFLRMCIILLKQKANRESFYEVVWI